MDYHRLQEYARVDCQKHEKAKSHMEASKMWETFDVVERVDICFSRARREEVERFNEEVRQNRAALRTLTEAVLYLSKQELTFRGHDESSVSLNEGNYRELLSLYLNLILNLNATFTEGWKIHKGKM